MKLLENIYTGTSANRPGSLPLNSIYFESDTGAYVFYGANGMVAGPTFRYEDLSVTPNNQAPWRADGVATLQFLYENYVATTQGAYVNGGAPANSFVARIDQYYWRPIDITSLADAHSEIGWVDEAISHGVWSQVNTDKHWSNSGGTPGRMYIGANGSATATPPSTAGQYRIVVGTRNATYTTFDLRGQRLLYDHTGAPL